ncbi:hypothetical protein CSUI_010648 [Cystoisospora suis]|uniref:Uncharacterized protein n=1 Tax=Cystoisospora suis TaxID=483139 RepID=A0A2C6JWU5_9APIC|nr:hypothetical protein CSUI_010648 [Cystoisospora suis]
MKRYVQLAHLLLQQGKVWCMYTSRSKTRQRHSSLRHRLNNWLKLSLRDANNSPSNSSKQLSLFFFLSSSTKKKKETGSRL